MRLILLAIVSIGTPVVELKGAWLQSVSSLPDSAGMVLWGLAFFGVAGLLKKRTVTQNRAASTRTAQHPGHLGAVVAGTN